MMILSVALTKAALQKGRGSLVTFKVRNVALNTVQLRVVCLLQAAYTCGDLALPAVLVH
jgi:hypothetical protein